MGAKFTVNSVVCAACLLGVAVAAALIWFRMLQVPTWSYAWFRFSLAIGAGDYAAYCAWWLVTRIVLAHAPALTHELKLELVYIAIVWIIMPPVWLFLDYFAVASNCIMGLPGNAQNLKQARDFADDASKVWAGVIALIVAVVAFRTSKAEIKRKAFAGRAGVPATRDRCREHSAL